MNNTAYKIKYLPLAVQDLQEIAQYLAGFYPQTARRVLSAMQQSIAQLHDMPERYEVYASDPFYRKMVVDKYLVFYHVEDATHTVEIHRILRGAWNVPQYLDEGHDPQA